MSVTSLQHLLVKSFLTNIIQDTIHINCHLTNYGIWESKEFKVKWQKWQFTTSFRDKGIL